MSGKSGSSGSGSAPQSVYTYPSEMLEQHYYYVDTVPDYLIQGNPPSEAQRKADMERKLQQLERDFHAADAGQSQGRRWGSSRR